MSRVLEEYAGIIESGTDKFGKEYTDWRTRFFGIPGLIVISETEHRRPTGKFLRFYPFDTEKDGMRLRASFGESEIVDGKGIMRTENSTYYFRIDEALLDDEDRHFLRSRMDWDWSSRA